MNLYVYDTLFTPQVTLRRSHFRYCTLLTPFFVSRLPFLQPPTTPVCFIRRPHVFPPCLHTAAVDEIALLHAPSSHFYALIVAPAQRSRCTQHIHITTPSSTHMNNRTPGGRLGRPSTHITTTRQRHSFCLIPTSLVVLLNFSFLFFCSFLSVYRILVSTLYTHSHRVRCAQLM